MNQYRDYRFYREFSGDVNLNLFHVTEGRHDYNLIHTFPFNVLAFCFETDGDDNVYTRMDTGENFSLSRPGEAVFVPSFTRVRYFARMGCRFLAFHFNLTFRSGIDLFRNSQKIRIFSDPALFRMAEEIDRTEKESLAGALKVESLILEVCSRFLPEECDAEKMAAEERYREVFEYIGGHLDATLSVSRAAAFFRTAPDAFSHRFSRDLGISPKQFIQQKLVGKISAELTGGNASVKELAEKFRFCSEFYFSSFFKRQTGFSPTEYRGRFRKSSGGSD